MTLSRGLSTKYRLLAIVAALVLVADRVTKQVVIAFLRLGESVPVWDDVFALTHVRNPGAAFSLFRDASPMFRTPFFLAVPLIALFAIGWLFRQLPAQSRLLSSALALVAGGALGNLIDRVVYGDVIDFLLVHWKGDWFFPAFNVADSAIFVGVALIMIQQFRRVSP